MGRPYPTRFINVPEARSRFGTSIDRLGELFYSADPLADAVVESFSKLGPGVGRRMLEEALRKGIGSVAGAPEPLRALFAEVDHVPAWVDRDAIERGGELLFRAGWFGGLALGTSLVYGYASPGGNKPLVFSGRLTEQAARRLIETSRFVEATCQPGGLRRFAEGFAITVKVRVMHAQVRKLMLQSDKWRTGDWGIPANQHDMGGTSLLFSAVVLDTLRKLGFRLGDEEVHLYMQLWRYSGYLIGVSPEVLPASEREARRLMEMLACTMSEPDDDSRKLTRALFDAREDDHMAGRNKAAEAGGMMIVKMGQGLIRGILGEVLADQLAVPDHGFKHLFPAVRALVARAEAAMSALPGPVARRARARAVASGKAYWAMLTRPTKAPFGFSAPEHLLGVGAVVPSALTRKVSPLAAAARSR